MSMNNKMIKNIRRQLGYTKVKTGERVNIYPISRVTDIIADDEGNTLRSEIIDIIKEENLQGKDGEDGKDGLVGYYPVRTIAERDNIDRTTRLVGMTSYVVESDKFYILKSGIENENWVELILGDGELPQPIGGYRSVEDITVRDTIPTDQRQLGMLCYVISEDTIYKLKGKLDNSGWIKVEFENGFVPEIPDIPEPVGGYRSVESINDRNAIPSNQREIGMLCYVITDSLIYQLKGGIEDKNWVEFKVGSTEVPVIPDPIGGYRTIESITARDAIPEAQRQMGMICYVTSDGNMYQLREGIKNTNWVKVEFENGFVPEIPEIPDPVGGYRSEKDVNARNAIPADQRQLGMLCYVISEDTIYKLKDSLENTGWVKLEIGSGSGSTGSATSISYSNTDYPTVSDALDALLYVKPVINSFTISPSIVEKGSTVSSVIFNWSLSKKATTLSISPTVGTLDVNTSTKELTDVNLKTNTTYTISMGDGKGNTTRSVTLQFQQKRYWGASTKDTLASSDILTLDNEFSTSKNQTKTITASAQYLYFAWPSVLGTPTFKVNGLANNAWVKKVITFTNASGESESYDTYRSQYPQTGTITVEVG